MKRNLMIIGSLGVALTAAIAGTLVNADDWSERLGRGGSGVGAVADARYRALCGECHMAYQPGLLPAASWQRVMDGLGDHFGDDAQLAPADADAVRDYLTANAADRVAGPRSRGFAQVARSGAAPLRVTGTRYFLGKHHEVPVRLARENPEVRSFANCPACHQRAEAGAYNEDEVRIPGVGRWDD